MDEVRWPVACLTCCRKLDVRQFIREEVTELADIPPEVRGTLGADGYKRTA